MGMQIQEERIHWLRESKAIDEHVDGIVKALRDDNSAVPPIYMAIDMVYRSYLKWVHSAQELQEDPTTVRDSLVHLLDIMIVEMCSRMTSSNDGFIAAADWTDSLIQKLEDELDEDLRRMVLKKKANNDI